MGILDMLAPSKPTDPVEVPPFVPSDKSALTDRELLEAVLTEIESFKYMAHVFSLQAQASPLLKSFVPKL